jgi:hypothetical protein
MKKLLVLCFVSCSLIAMRPPAPAPIKGKLPIKDYDQKLQNQFVDAVRKGNYAQVKRMLKFRPKISLNGTDSQHDIPLALAVMNQNRTIAELLLAEGANVNTLTGGMLDEGYPKPLIFTTVKNGDLEMTELLLSYGAKLEYKYKTGSYEITIQLKDSVPANHPNSQKIRDLIRGKTKIL